MGKKSKTDWQRLAGMGDADIDTGDISALNDTDLINARLRVPIITTGELCIDGEVIEWFKSRNENNEMAINEVLRKYIASQSAGEG